MYETGRLINHGLDEFDNMEYKGITGASLRFPLIPADPTPQLYFVTRIKYEEPYLTYFKDFIRAQEKYPEVFNIFSDQQV